MENNKNSVLRTLTYVVGSVTFGLFIGVQLSGGRLKSLSVNKNSAVDKLKQVVSLIDEDYVDEVNADSLVEATISSLLDNLDPHSVYIPASEQELSESQLRGNFEGIGVEFSIFNDTIAVVTSLSGGPSEKLGIRSGDKIITVDNEVVAGIGINNREVIKRLRGPKNSEVKVGIQRTGESSLLEFKIKRDVIPQYSVDVSYMVDPETGYIKVSRFSATTYDEFKKSIEKLKEMGMKQLILDLTGNPGGYLDRAVRITDEFLSENELIVFTQGKEERYNETHIARESNDFEELPLVVMIDEGSASASEIVAGALQDHDRAILVGRRSFGKGLVQIPFKLADESELRLTISRYYTPSGRCIQKPYNGSTEDYNQDLLSRLESGEVFIEDSMEVNQEETFYTDNGRKVYGGGGIIPDSFVPIDTLGNSRYLNQLFTSNSLQEFTIQFANENRTSLEKLGKEKYITTFKINEEQINQLTALAASRGVKLIPADLEKSKALIELYAKAYIARLIWENEGFYPIFNQQNEIFKKALELIRDSQSLALIKPTPQ